MNKKIKIITATLLISAVIPTVTVLADSEPVKSAISTLVSRYMQNSSQAESITLNDTKQKSDDYTIINSIEELEQQIESNENTIKKLECGQGTGTHTEQQYQADYQRVYGYELEMKLGLYKMQEQLDLLYSEYSEKITEQQNGQLELAAYRLLWDIHSNSEKKAYLEGLTRQKEHELTVMCETLKLGYATESDVLAAEAELEQVKAELAACENENAVLLRKYELGAGSKAADFSAEYTEAEYSVQTVLKKFEENSFYPEYYRRQAEEYTKYAETLTELKKKMKDSKYNQEYFDRVQEYIADETAYYTNEAALAENRAVQYDESLELFVYEACGNANSLSAQRKAVAAALKTAEKQLEIARALLEEGRINETALMEAENSVLKLKYELAEAEGEVMCGRYVLDNLIENF